MSGICLALDGLAPRDALVTAHKLRNVVDGFKIQELVDVAATDDKARNSIAEIQRIDLPIVFDLKLLDTSDAMRRRASYYDFPNAMITVHGRTDVDHIRAAVEGAGQAKVFVVTALTSETPEGVREETGDPVDQVIGRRAEKAVEAGAHGIVCSPLDLPMLRQFKHLATLARLTPGIRPAGDEADDQVRVCTPFIAGKNGSTWAVVGRPILRAENQVTAATAIRDDFQRGREAFLAK